MLCEVQLNKEQQAFAADHHGLVYKFLNENRLPEDEFYAVILFGYLRAVYRYFNEPKLQKYDTKLAAIAIWRFSVFMSWYIPMVRL